MFKIIERDMKRLNQFAKAVNNVIFAIKVINMLFFRVLI